MGCCASRIEKRWDAAKNNFSVTPLAFVGGNEKEAWDEFPFDKILWKFGKNADKEWNEIVDAGDNFAVGSEEQATAVYHNTITWLTRRHEALKSKHGEKSADNKVVWLEGKYNAHEVIAQLKATIDSLKEHAGIPDPNAPKVEKETKPEVAEGEAAANEGGDGADVVDNGDEKKSAGGAGDAHDYKGW
jgi:hypothetical protein